MIYPIKGTIVVTGPYLDKVSGSGLPDRTGQNRHVGVDLRARTPQPCYAVGAGVVTASYTNQRSGLQVIEIHIGKHLWRFLHLSQRLVKVGDKVKEGQLIGKTGNSGGVPYHLHFDARKQGTTWNASLNNYVNPMTLIQASQVKPPVKYRIRVNKGTWNVRKSPDGALYFPKKYVRGGQTFTCSIEKGWAKIAPAQYIGPVSFRKI